MTDKPLCNAYMLGKQFYDDSLTSTQKTNSMATKVTWYKVIMIICLIFCLIFSPITILLLNRIKFTGLSITALVITSIFLILFMLCAYAYTTNKTKLNTMINEKSNCIYNPSIGPQTKKI